MKIIKWLFVQEIPHTRVEVFGIASICTAYGAGHFGTLAFLGYLGLLAVVSLMVRAAVAIKEDVYDGDA